MQPSRGASLPIVVPALAIGLVLGLGAYTFIYAKGYAYLTDDPRACANCHVMEEQYSAWLKSSHKGAAVCNDCHTPEGSISKYVVKASNGFWHSFAFTTGRFPHTLAIKPSNREVTESRCRSCHRELTSGIDIPDKNGEGVACTKCHANVGHEH
jgi:cytochrome c nitrite reductase small subunit